MKNIIDTIGTTRFLQPI